MPTQTASPTPRVAITAVFAAFGVIAGIWSGSVPTVARSVGLDGYWLGATFTGLMLCNVVAMSVGGQLARAVSSRWMLLTVIPVMAGAAILVHWFSSLWIFLPALFGFGFAQGLCDLFMNAEGSRIEAELGRPIYSGLHGVCSLSLAIGAIFGSLIAVGIGPWASAPIFAAAGCIAAWLVWRAIPERPPVKRPGSARPVLAAVYGPLALLGLAVGFENAGEIAAILWSAKLLNEVAPALASIAGIGPAFYAGCNALVRLNGDLVRARYGDKRVVIASLLIAAAGLVGVGVLPGFGERVAAFAVIGFGTACIIPCLYAIASNTDPERRAARLGFVSMVAGPPRVLSPLVFGWVAQFSSMSTAFGLSSLLLVLALGLFLASQAGMARQAAVSAA